MDSLNGEEKKDASKEDLEQEEGKRGNYLTLQNYSIIWKKILANGNITDQKIFTAVYFKLIMIIETTSIQI